MRIDPDSISGTSFVVTSKQEGGELIVNDTASKQTIEPVVFSTTSTDGPLSEDELFNLNASSIVSRVRLLNASLVRPTQLVKLLGELISSDVLETLKNRAANYISAIQYKPIAFTNNRDLTTYKEPITYKPDKETLDQIIEFVVDAAIDPKIATRVIERVLFKPEVLAKLALIWEHGFMLNAKEPKEKEQVLQKLIRQYANDDAVLRFIQEEIPFIDLKNGDKINTYRLVSNDPDIYSRVAILHRWACRKAGVDPNDVDKQRSFGNGRNPIKEELIRFLTSSEQKRSLKQVTANLRQDAPIPCDRNVNIGETVFFKPLIDDKTLSPTQFILDAFERGVKNVEISTDLLPFDPSKRLSGEYIDEEITRVRELANKLSITFTVHSAIVGPLHPKTKFTALLEDAADNVQVVKDSIDFAHKLGAKTVVVHISDKNSEEAIKRYSEIAFYASGKLAADGTPLRIAFENYLSKANTDGVRIFSTIEEHFEAFSKIIKQSLKDAVKQGQDPTKLLQHITLLLDSAHFNLVPNLDDPLHAPLVLLDLTAKLGNELLIDEEIGPKLKETGFDISKFVRGIVSELHLNQNIGPITFTVQGKDYNADIHNPVESIGTIDNIGFVALVQDAGFGYVKEDGTSDLIILAEQKKSLSPGGLQILYNAAKDYPGVDIPRGKERVKYFIDKGAEIINKFKTENSDEYNKLVNLLEKNGEIHPHYAYLAGRFGIEHLVEHLNRRAFHHVLSAQVDLKLLEESDGIPLQDIVLKSYNPGEIIVKKGTTYKEATESGTNRFYLIAKGSAVVNTGEKQIELKPGTPFGEVMFLSGTPRSADVSAGPSGATIVEISENDFWAMYKLLVPFQERLDIHHDLRKQ